MKEPMIDRDNQVEGSQEVEHILRRYRPAGPAPELRSRILGAEPVPTSWRLWLAWPAAAVLLLLTIGFHWATESVDRRTTALLQAGESWWVLELERTSQFPGGDAAARGYVAALLAEGFSDTEMRVDAWIDAWILDSRIDR